MPYQSRYRKYRTPREKNAVVSRNVKMILLFISLALIVYGYKHRYELWGWLQAVFS